MKKYLILIVGIVALITVGSAGAAIIGSSTLIVNKTTVIESTFVGGGDLCGGNCTQHGGCHNESNFTEITGVLVYEGSKYKIGTIIINFGSYCYLSTTTSPYDFDGDGTIEILLDEINGLVGDTITVKGFLNCMGTRLNAFFINGIQYREY